ncbi:MAG: hypothetical protein KKI08_00805 [Armatimonadetes bacterium]|nr:hypothetical protein [Armatimonadota bacterium]
MTRLTRLVAGELEHSADLEPLRRALRDAMAHCLGVARIGDVARMLREQMGWEQAPSVEAMRIMASILNHTSLRLRLRAGDGLVEHPDACEALRQRVAAKTEVLLQEIQESEHILDFVYHLTQACRNGHCERSRFTSQIPCCGGERGETNLPCEYVTAVLSEMAPCPLDGDRVWGYWWTRLRLPRPKTEAVRAALHILERPVHYSELNAFISEHNPAFSPTDERYVLHQLIDNDEYVLTGKLGT